MKPRRGFHQPTLALQGNFQGGEDEPHILNRIALVDDKVNVLRHDEVSPQGHIAPAPGRLTSIEEPKPGAVAVKERKPTETGKG
jgi:hypothetical protein